MIFSTLAQNNHTIYGQLIDSSGKEQIANATVSLMNAKDSSLIAFTRTDSIGKFLFNKLPTGNYRLTASHVNFHQVWKNFSINYETLLANLGIIMMVDKSILQSVNITAIRPPVVVNGDTLEFNAEAFKTKPNAVVEDMLKKMPGVDIDKDGTIKVNGKRINRVLVNGKDFFNGDPTLATRNLNADAIDKVQVFDKQTDQASFTGVDDGNAEKTINLKLKKDKMNAVFGKASLAAGTDNRLEGKFNLNKFKGQQQLSTLGMINNTNQQGFALMDVLNFSGQNKKMMKGGGGIVINNSGPEDFGVPVAGLNGNAQGITRTIAGGLNYNDLLNKKTDLNTSYFYNNQQTDNETIISRKNLVKGNNFNYDETVKSLQSKTGNRINIAIDQSLDTFNSFKFTGNGAIQKGFNNSNSSYLSATDVNDTLNKGITNNKSTSDGENLESNLLFKHKFHKKGRTISFNEVMQYNNSHLNSLLNSYNTFYNPGGINKTDTVDQMNNLRSITKSIGSNVTYTEPLSKKMLFEFRGFYNYGTGDLNKVSFDLNQTSGKHDIRNSALSSAFKNEYNTAGGGMSVRGLGKKYTYSAGLNLQSSGLKSQLLDSLSTINNTSFNVLPLASLNYNFTKFKTIHLDYNTSITQPSSTQLQPVKDISDPLNIRQGNPSLLQSYTHSLGVQYFITNIAKQSNLIAFANYSVINNAIVNSDSISNVGQRITKPVNANGVYNIFALIEKGFRIKALATRLSLGTNVMYNHNINFINSQLEQTGNTSFIPKFSAEYSYKELIDLSFTARLNFNHVKYSIESQLNDNYLKQQYNADATLTTNRFTFYTNIEYTVNSGRSDGYNKNVAMWDVALSKQVFKSKKGEIKLSVNNLLNQNIGIDRNSNFNYIEDIRYKTLARYFMVGFTYSLQKPSSGGPKIVMKTF